MKTYLLLLNKIEKYCKVYREHRGCEKSDSGSLISRDFLPSDPWTRNLAKKRVKFDTTRGSRNRRRIPEPGRNENSWNPEINWISSSSFKKFLKFQIQISLLDFSQKLNPRFQRKRSSSNRVQESQKNSRESRETAHPRIRIPCMQRIQIRTHFRGCRRWHYIPWRSGVELPMRCAKSKKENRILRIPITYFLLIKNLFNF